MKKGTAYLHNWYNATSTEHPKGSDKIESYQHWLERQLLSRIEQLESHSKSNTPSGVSDKIEEFIKENLPHANESFHYEAEAATALREFGEWCQKRDTEVNPERKFPGRLDPAEVNPYDSKGRNRLKSRR